MVAISLTTTQEQFEALHEAVEGRAKTVRVDAVALLNLLIDHTALVREARAKGIKIAEPGVIVRQKYKERRG